MPHPADPAIYDRYMHSASGYVDLAEQAHGEVPKPVSFDYIWGESLAEFERVDPDIKLINLETAVTTSDDYWKGKGIHYRMHPDNVVSISAAGIDVCPMANNHVLYWGYSGLAETLKVLKKAGLQTVGAGSTLDQSRTPATFALEQTGRVIVFSFGSPTSGIPSSWGAANAKPGVNLIEDLSDKTIIGIRKQVEDVKRAGDIVIASIHWGGNWGYEIRLAQRNDDLSLMYFPQLEAGSGRLMGMEMVPTLLRRFRIRLASEIDAVRLHEVLNRGGERSGTRFEMARGTRLALVWD